MQIIKKLYSKPAANHHQTHMQSTEPKIIKIKPLKEKILCYPKISFLKLKRWKFDFYVLISTNWVKKDADKIKLNYLQGTALTNETVAIRTC